MSGQAQTLIASWQPTMMSERVGSPREGRKGEAGGTVTEETKTTKTVKQSIIKAGTILFGVLDTAVNSDYPDTPVLATIVSEGPFKGAKLLGKLQVAQSTPGQSKDRVSLTFSLMDMPSWTSSKGVNAFAIDPDTARTVMASNVDYHYLKRYGSIMGAAFLTGYSNAITQAGTSTTGIFGTSTTHPSLSPTQKIAVGLGQVGTTIGAQIQNYINIPPTVTVNAGVGLGILFMGEVTQ
jgi:intracellular multiplication protein IcmE